MNVNPFGQTIPIRPFLTPRFSRRSLLGLGLLICFGATAELWAQSQSELALSSKTKTKHNPISGSKELETNGRFVVVVNRKHGYIDRKGNIVIGPRFESASTFSEDLAFVALGGRENKKGYVDRAGKLVIPPKFDAARNFHEGLAAVAFDLGKERVACDDCEPNQNWGFIDKNGNIIISPQFRYAGDFSEGLASVETQDGKWGFIDRTGRVVIELQYEYAYDFSEGLACVLSRKKFGYVDLVGRMVIKPQFSRCHAFSEGLAAVATGGEAISPLSLGDTTSQAVKIRKFIDKTGRTVIKLNVESAGDFSEGLAPVEVKKSNGTLQCGYIDARGAMIIPPQFSNCDNFSEGLALVLYNAKWSYIDRSGKVLFITPFALASDFRDGLARVQLGGTNVFDPDAPKFGYIDKLGTTIWKPTN